MPGFMSGNLSMTVCVFEKGGILDVEELRKCAFSEALDPNGEKFGWVGLGLPLDTNNFFLAACDARFSGFSYRLDTRKVSKAVINLHLAEKIREEESSGQPVGSKRKKELREAISDTLISQAEFVPCITDCLWDSEKGRLFIASTSEKMTDRILDHFHNTFGREGHYLEPEADMFEVFSKIQKENGIGAGNYSIQPLGSARLASIEASGEKSAVAVENNSVAVGEALGQGLSINRIGLVATRENVEEELAFTIDSSLKLGRIRLPKAEKGAEEEATFLINADICARIADITEILAGISNNSK